MHAAKKKRSIKDFFTHIPAQESRILFFDKLQLMSFYFFSIILLFALGYNIVVDYYDQAYMVAMVGLIYFIIVILGLVLFWITRKLVYSQWIMAFTIFSMMTMVIIIAGGHYGLGTLYFFASFSIFYLILDYRTGVILPVYFLIGMLIRFSLGNFHPNSIFQDGEVRTRFIIILIIASSFGVISSIALKYLIDHLSRLAFHDRVTGLPNKVKFREYIYSRIYEKKSLLNGFTLAGLKIMNLNRINSNSGIEASDWILNEVARILEQYNLPYSSRWSGSIFFVVIETTDFVILDSLSRKIMDHLSTPFVSEKHSISGQFAMSISRFGIDSHDMGKLIDNVITQLDDRSRIPGDIVFYDHDKLLKLQYKHQLNEAMDRADMDREFSLVFQPKIKLEDLSCIGAELLIRWNNKDHGSISPSLFIPMAEESGFIKKISLWVLENAFRKIKEIQNLDRANKKIYAINLSVLNLKDPQFLKHLIRWVDEFEVDPHTIEFEMTEGIQADQDPRIMEFLNFVCDMGFQIAIDDFGTGYSSLSYLHRLNVHDLKIDKSFIDQIDSDSCKKGIPVVDAIISMGLTMGLSITAEGVEQEVQAKYLKERSCHFVQGWLYSKALTMDDLLIFFKEFPQLDS